MNLRQKLMTLLVKQALRRGLALPVLAVAIDKAAWDKLDKAVQPLYVEKDGKYALDVELEDNDGLKKALKAERERANKNEKAVKELTERFEGIDPDEVRKLLADLNETEEGKLLKAGKYDEVWTKKTEKLRQEHAKQLEAAEKKYQGALEVIDSYMEAVVDNEIRAAATKAGVHQHAIDDALFRGRQLFSVDDQRRVVKLDADGHPVLGKNGKDPYMPGEWVEEMKKDAPHWFPHGSSGGGANGGAKDAAGKVIVKRADFEAMNPVDRQRTAADHRAGKVILQD